MAEINVKLHQTKAKKVLFAMRKFKEEPEVLLELF